MSLIVKPYTFSVGAVIIASQHNSNFDTIYSDYNGSITTSNLSASAAIVDTQLAQITTTGKVSGTALTSLTSIPAGAGILPTANLGSGTANSSKVLSGAQTYVDPTTLVTGLLGAWTTKSDTTIYQATTDGFVIGIPNPAGNTTNTFEILSDSSNPPTTVRAHSQSVNASGTGVSIFSPVKKNDYYELTKSGTSAAYAAIYFIPLGS